MGFLDKAKQAAQQAQQKIEEQQKKFNEQQQQRAQQGGQGGAPVQYDQTGQPIQQQGPPAGQAPPPAAAPAAAPAPPTRLLPPISRPRHNSARTSTPLPIRSSRSSSAPRLYRGAGPLGSAPL